MTPSIHRRRWRDTSWKSGTAHVPRMFAPFWIVGNFRTYAICSMFYIANWSTIYACATAGRHIWYICQNLSNLPGRSEPNGVAGNLVGRKHHTRHESREGSHSDGSSVDELLRLTIDAHKHKQREMAAARSASGSAFECRGINQLAWLQDCTQQQQLTQSARGFFFPVPLTIQRWRLNPLSPNKAMVWSIVQTGWIRRWSLQTSWWWISSVSTPTLLARVELQRHVGVLCYYCQLHHVRYNLHVSGADRYNNLHAQSSGIREENHTRMFGSLPRSGRVCTKAATDAVMLLVDRQEWNLEIEGAACSRWSGRQRRRRGRIGVVPPWARERPSICYAEQRTAGRSCGTKQ